ncbi:MAG: serine hydrolase [Betaproteobacteria bacterium]|nr:serine hydrolase [Betaproteobacteria bacterium]
MRAGRAARQRRGRGDPGHAPDRQPGRQGGRGGAGRYRRDSRRDHRRGAGGRKGDRRAPVRDRLAHQDLHRPAAGYRRRERRGQARRPGREVPARRHPAARQRGRADPDGGSGHAPLRPAPARNKHATARPAGSVRRLHGAGLGRFPADLYRHRERATRSSEYSNVGAGLLGVALTRAAGVASYEALLRAHPATARHGEHDQRPAAFAERMTQPHDAQGRPTPAWHLPFAHAAAGAIRATAGDMGRYAEAMVGLKDSPLAKAITVALTMREQGPGRNARIGLAWMQIPYNDRPILNHNGATFGSSCLLLVDPVAREAVFIVANSAVQLREVALHLLDRRHSLAPRAFPKIVPVAADVLARYAGTYKLNDKMDVVVRVNGGKVTVQATGQSEFEIFPESEQRFFARVAPVVLTFGEMAEDKAVASPRTRQFESDRAARSLRGTTG